MHLEINAKNNRKKNFTTNIGTLKLRKHRFTFFHYSPSNVLFSDGITNIKQLLVITSI